MDYQIIRSVRKTVSITVTREGEVVVRAPLGFPREKIDAFVKEKDAWIRKTVEKQKIPRPIREELSLEAEARLRKAAREELSAKTAYYAKLMNLTYGRISITGAKTRFGSCSSKGNIAYSFRLMLYPEAARDYVVVHELSHRRQMDHSKKFWAIVAAYLPDYKERRKLLR